MGEQIVKKAPERLPERCGDPKAPRVGDAATFTVWTDSHACTVVYVSPRGSRLTLQCDKAIRTDKNGYSEVQFYRYESDPCGRRIKISRRLLPNGQLVWKEVGHRTTSPGNYAQLGVRREYMDPSF